MACKDQTPWSKTNWPYPINRHRVTCGGGTSQSTGAWISETISSTEICGYIGRGVANGVSGMHAETLESLAGGQFKTGDQRFVCHTDCDVALGDIIEVYADAVGTTKQHWRVITKLKELTIAKNLLGYGQNIWLVRMEER